MRPRRIRRGTKFGKTDSEALYQSFNEAPANSPGTPPRPKRLNSDMGCAGLRALPPRDFDSRRMAVGSAFLLVKDRWSLNTLWRFER